MPRPVPDEVIRARLIQRLEARFQAAVTTVVGGAGFGKTTAVAQAVRHNQLMPEGVDAWVSCRPGYENAEVLAGAILAALGSPTPQRPSAVESVLAAIVQRSPLEVAVIVDDCHLLRATSSERLLGALARHLPANGHLLLCGRWLPEVPLARLEAAGSVRRMTAGELAFNEREVSTMCDRLGLPADQAGDAGGWPALVRLALAARPGVQREFLREEVLGDLPRAGREALVALTLLGPSTDAEVRRVAPDAEPLVDLAARVPLITVIDGDRYVAHQLWEQPAQATVEPGQLTEWRQRARTCLLGAGDLHRAGALAIAEGDWVALGLVASAVVGASMTNLPLDTVRNWLGHVPADHGQPGIDLLAAAARFAASGCDPTVGDELDALIAAGRRSGDVVLESRAIAVAAVVAHGCNDPGRLIPLAGRAAELADEVDEPVLGVLGAALPAIAADLRGDPDGVLEAFASVPWDRLPTGVGMTARRLQIQALWMAGRAGESVEIAERVFADAADTLVRGQGGLARWFAGDPSGIPITDETRFVGTISARDRFVTACFWTVILASAGSCGRIERIWRDVPVGELAQPDARDSAHLTNALAARAVLDHDESAAARHFRTHLDEHPLTDALGERHLRRWPALGYVLCDELRAHWDSVPLGPAHEMARECARALLAARSGAPLADRTPTPAEMFTQLPLPWTVELAVRWRLAGEGRAEQLLAELTERVPEAATGELGRIAGGRGVLAEQAAAMCGETPAVPAGIVELAVLGPLELRRDGQPVDAPELRRARVRQLLTLLAVERTVRRDRVMELLWPGMDQAGASSNLRVTLAHLRKVLEPERRAGAAGFRLRTDAETIRLHPGRHMIVDLWRHLELSAAIRDGQGDPRDDHRLLDEMVGLWRGDPLADLAEVDDLAGQRQRLSGEHVDALIRLGELNVVTGAPAAAFDCASRVLAIDPYREAAHRLAVAALIQLDDAPGVAGALARLDAALEELGARPESSTEILRRHAAARFGRALTPR